MIKKIGVIGAGQMGRGIAHACAGADFKVKLFDGQPGVALKAISEIAQHFDLRIQKIPTLAPEKHQILAGLEEAKMYEDFSDVDLVTEAIPEDFDLKAALLKNVSPFLKKDALMVTNTSSLSITRLAAQTNRPDRFMGVHFMNPVLILPLVELIKGLTTSQDTFETLKGFVLKLGKKISVSNDYPGFIVNRILLPMINEAIYTYFEGVGTVEAIDEALRLGANHPMGPLKLADLIGLDTCLAILRTLDQELAGARYRPCPLLVKYVEAGWLGKKTGRGFYVYK